LGLFVSERSSSLRLGNPFPALGGVLRGIPNRRKASRKTLRVTPNVVQSVAPLVANPPDEIYGLACLLAGENHRFAWSVEWSLRTASAG
jgi:hypothetical protein